jgi:ATP-dependent RNA helicase MSS116
LVVQTGVPSSTEQYIHRLGRTARAGASGRGILILSSFEKWFLREKDVAALPIHPHPAFPALPTEEIDTALISVDQMTKAQAYQAWLGYYSVLAKKMGITAPQLVEMANTYVMEVLKYQGDQTPPILAKTVSKMNMRGVPGFNIVKTKEQLQISG